MEIKTGFLNRINDNPLYSTIGIQIEQAGDGKAISHLEPNPKLCWPFPGQPHGGVLFTLMDTTMAWAVFSQLDQGYNCATIHIDIDFTLPAKGNRFNCSALVTQRTGHLSFLRAEIQDDDGQ